MLVLEMGETSLGREEEEGVGGSVDCRVSMPRLRYRVSDRVRALDEQADCLCLCHGLGVGQQSEAGSEARRDVMMK